MSALNIKLDKLQAVEYIVLENQGADQPWSTVVSTVGTPADLVARMRLAICEEYCLDSINITKIEFSTVSMMGFVDYTDHDGDENTLNIGYCTVYN